MPLSRRDWIKTVGAVGLVSGTTQSVAAAVPEKLTNIGTRRELFVENSLITKLTGGGQLRLHQPVPRELAFVCDKPWEGSSCAYMKVSVVPS